MTNKINLFYIFIISLPVIWVFTNLSDYGLKSYVRFIVLIVVAVSTIYLNSIRRHLAAKILTIVAPFFCVFVMPIFNKFVHAGMFIWFPYGIIVVGALSFFIFSLDDKNEKSIMIVTLLFFSVATVYFDDLLKNFVDKSIDLTFIEENQLFYTTSQVVIVVLLYFSFYSFKLIYYKQQKELTKLNSMLDNKNNELSFLNQNLDKLVIERSEN